MEMENKAVDVKKNDAVPIELPAPPGWKKRFTPRKSGTPRRNDIVFVAPDGDEIKNKRQLDKYLKSHPGGPPASEFDWGTGDTPRRSSRLGEKSKATESPESETPSKRPRKSSSKKGAKEDAGEQEAEGATEKETEGSAELAMPDAEDLDAQDVDASKEVPTDGDNIKDDEKKNNDGEIVPEKPPASEDKMEIVPEKEAALGEGNIEKLENQEAEDKPLDNSLQTDKKPLTLNVLEENNIQSEPAGTDASSHSVELNKETSARQEESAEEAPAADVLNVLEENKIESKPAELSKATSVSQEKSAEEAPAAADALVQNSNDAKVEENEQIDREIPIEEINGKEAAAVGVNNSVENNSVQQQATVVDQVTPS
ncbi:methyl-CpG-binding domain-containing protein 11-like [Lycium barbarum]|uniref:methyl-CpG-binding domain-containing protein 11-like n=1 Tax=Lycium barbarum TaxID=112863 RepID=UPI00293F387D|nr:methyl-CpG-binding domain-containing protein 11-like [Lycium barbarum]XP_060169920.1 methyl-CpG-binding domain-containing protein 11-like [Lycium barbarum]